MGARRYANGFSPTVHPELLTRPALLKKPRLVFVNSMGDLFHSRIPRRFIGRVFESIHQSPQHAFQALTKRSGRLRALAPELEWPTNLWMGVTVESAAHLSRIDDLRATGARIKFVSFEPLLGPLGRVDLRGIDWVIAGGESGPGARPMARDWVTEVRDACVEQGVPFFFKQWGGSSRRRNGRILDGRVWGQYPVRATDGA